MANRIELNYNGKTYTLEFSRRIILQMEEDGALADLQNDIKVVKKTNKNGENVNTTELARPLKNMVRFVRYAFRKNHSDVTDKEIDDIIDDIPDLVAFFNAVMEIFSSCANALNSNTNSGNVSWGKK